MVMTSVVYCQLVKQAILFSNYGDRRPTKCSSGRRERESISAKAVGGATQLHVCDTKSHKYLLCLEKFMT